MFRSDAPFLAVWVGEGILVALGFLLLRRRMPRWAAIGLPYLCVVTLNVVLSCVFAEWVDWPS
jgi:hypothetical protein